MGADTISAVGGTPNGDNSGVTTSDGGSGGAGRGGASTGSGSPLVVVQPPRAAAPPRPAPDRSRTNADNSLRNGYAAISHSVSGETAAIGAGFLLGGPVGAVVAGAAAPAAVAAVAWRARRREDNENANRHGAGSGNSPGAGSGNSDRNSSGGGRGNGGGTGRNNAPGGGRHRTPNSNGSGGPNGSGGGKNDRKPKTKDPVADTLGKLGKDLADKLKPGKGGKDKGPKNGKGGGTDPKGKGDKAGKDGAAKGLKDGLRNGPKGLLKDRGKQPDSERPWRGRGEKDPKAPKHKKDRKKKGRDTGADDTSSTTARDGLDPKGPKTGPTAPELEQVLDGELVDEDIPAPREQDIDEDEIVDAEIVDDAAEAKREKRIAAIRAKRERARRREAIRAGKKAADKAARDGDAGDPRAVRREVISRANAAVDTELHRENHLISLTKRVEERRSQPVNYPAVQAAPAGTRTAGVAVARQIEFRGTEAYRLLRALADQLARGYRNDEDADMADHIVELTGIPNMCKNLSLAVVEAANALARSAPLHPSVIKHLNNAAQAARTAGVMADQIMAVFVQAHREDIIRVLDPRLGEERWNIRNARGTLDAAKLKAAIATAHSARLALPGGATNGGGQGGGNLVPAVATGSKKLVDLMKGFTRGHMVVVLSEVNGSANGVDAVADSIGKLYRRMTDTWPTEGIVDDTVAKTAGHVRRVSTELKKAVRQAQKMHARELKLNTKGRGGKGARAERKWDVAGRRGSN